MPTYIYQHPDTKEVIEVVQSVNDEHIYIDSNGIRWDRIFTIPQVNTQEKLNIDSTSKDFARVTSSQKGKMGDLWDRSKELSDKRKERYGEDPVKKEYYNNWSKKRRNRIHPNAHSE